VYFWYRVSVLLKETRKKLGIVGVSVEIRVGTSSNTAALTHSVINSWGLKIYENDGSHRHLNGAVPLCCALRTPLVQDSTARNMRLSGF